MTLETNAVNKPKTTMRTKLITALRITAKAIENGTFKYRWDQSQSCNCGAVACALTGKSSIGMLKALTDTINAGASWQEKVMVHCPMTGMPEHEVLAAMVGAGMSTQDIVDLEFLKNKEVLKRIKLETPRTIKKVEGVLFWKKETDIPDPQYRHYSDPKNAIRYMRAWADMLAEEDKQDAPEPEPVPEQEPVPA